MTDERPMSLAAAAKLLPGRRGHASIRTVVRYALEGVRVHGQVVRLRSWRVGGQRVTSAAAIAEFVHRCNERAVQTLGASVAEHHEAALKATKELSRLGI